eukprot:11916944-Alexandrium_andersonii.AAC.1
MRSTSGCSAFASRRSRVSHLPIACLARLPLDLLHPAPSLSSAMAIRATASVGLASCAFLLSLAPE